MWTKAHRVRHEARLKDMVTASAVGEIARWLALRPAQESGPAALAATLGRGGAGVALARGRPLAGVARRLPAMANRLWDANSSKGRLNAFKQALRQARRLLSAIGGAGLLSLPERRL